MVVDDENHEIREELNIDEIESNLVNMLFLNLKNRVNLLEEDLFYETYICTNRTYKLTFPLCSSKGKLHHLKKLILPHLTKEITP